jgi:hypothetical protein
MGRRIAAESAGVTAVKNCVDAIPPLSVASK